MAYADDTYTITSARMKENVAAELGTTLTMITKWFKSSGLKVNKTKTEITIFQKNNCNPAEVLINGKTVRMRDTIKVLGTTMDTTLTWQEQVNNTVKNTCNPYSEDIVG